MRAAAVVVVAPFGDQLAGVAERAERRLVEALVAQPAVEALHERVLDRLAGLDVVPVDATLLLPGENGRRCQLSAIVADDQMRLAATADDRVELGRRRATCRQRVRGIRV